MPYPVCRTLATPSHAYGLPYVRARARSSEGRRGRSSSSWHVAAHAAGANEQDNNTKVIRQLLHTSCCIWELGCSSRS